VVVARSSLEVTKLLRAWSAGEDRALEELIPLVYQELRRMARRQMLGEKCGHTLQTTALVHEAYLRLLGSRNVNWQDRAHFFAISARLMRRVLVEFARARGSQKRGGGILKITLDEAVIGPAEKGRGLLALDDALHALAGVDARKCKVVELRFFGGLSVEETAAVLEVSPDTVFRDWRLARAWLVREMGKSDSPAPGRTVRNVRDDA
jgi:RNA polymerase sigma-70 factor, ECF subfamily